MLEAILIMSIVYACLYLPLRGKDFSQLTPKQQQRVEKHFVRHMKSRKGKQTPDMTIEEFLPIIQKQGLTYLIMAIVVAPIYVLVVFLFYFA